MTGCGKIESLLRRAEFRRRGVLVAGGFLAAAALPAGILLALCWADNLLALPAPLRHAGAAAVLLAALWLLGRRGLLPLCRRASREEAALRVERANRGLDNLLVNSVLLQERSGREPMVDLLLDQGEAAAGRADPTRVAPWSTLKRGAFAAFLGLAAWVFYLALLPGAAANAWHRLYLGDGQAPPLAAVAWRVEPGDCQVVRGEDLEIRAVVISGEIPERAVLQLDRGGERASFPMEFDGSGFLHLVPNLRRDLRYHLTWPGGRTRDFKAEILVPATPEEITASFSYPAYTKKSPERGIPIQGPIDRLRGTRAEVTFRFNRPLRGALVTLPGRGPAPMTRLDRHTWSFAAVLERSGTYRVRATDTEGRRGEPLAFPLRAREDLPPQVKVTRPGRDIFCTEHTSVPLEVMAGDDVGLRRVSLAAGRGEKEKILCTWPATGERGRFQGVLQPAELGCRAGDVLHYYALAEDLKGTCARSRLYTVTVRTPREERQRLAAGLESLLERVERILHKQVQARRRNEKLLARPAGLGRARWRRETGALAAAQEEIRADTLAVLADWNDPLLARAPARVLLEMVAAGEMARVIQVFVRASSRGRPAMEPLQRAAGLQRVIEKILRRVLASGRELARLLRTEGPEKALRESAQRLRRSTEKLTELAARLREFIEEQEEIVKATAAIRRVKPQDFTGSELSRLQALAQAEQKWAGLLMEAWNDLSKLHPQDFSNSRLCTELLEAYSEVELAADALTRKAVVMAVPYEQSGLELAKSITENIERWLDDARDHLKWVMEEPPEDYEVPLADLPEELEDLMGDLLDSEEGMSEESEDVTSGWMDSLNEGAGWTAMDGPISNMSAKGVTGNLLPNSNEVGGRSGEGRTAKSAGQMVEKSATGKGGRRTPTRYTPDPFEGGEVKDSGKDPASGSTGGGKLSGAGEQGLRGVPSPLLQRRMQRLAGKQAKIRQTAERLRHQLRIRRFYVKELDEAIRLMASFEKDLKQKRPADYAARRKAISDRLSRVANLVGDRLRLQREGTYALSRRLRRHIRGARAERPPEEYRLLVEDYFRALLGEGR